MKKLILLLFFAGAVISLFAQQKSYKFGIKGGLSYVHLENYGKGYYSDFEPLTGWCVGALFQYKTGGFVNYSVVPEIMFTSSTTDVDLIYITDCKTTIQSIDIPVSFKVGLQLSKIFRPYVLGTVYGSYVVEYKGDIFYMLDDYESLQKKNINKFFFGVGTGLGFDIWKFQIEGRYRWNLNSIVSEDYDGLKQMGLELTLAFLL